MGLHWLDASELEREYSNQLTNSLTTSTTPFTMLFTTIPAKPNVTSSDKFKERGCNGDIAAPISEVSILGLPTTTTLEYQLFQQNLSAHAAAWLENKPITVDPKAPFHPVSSKPPVRLFTPPPIGVSFNTNQQNPDVVKQMTRLSFSRESVGRNTYYKGVLDPDQVVQLMDLGALVDTFTPNGVTNLRGFLAFILMEKVIAGANASFPGPVHDSVKNKDFYRAEFTATVRSLDLLHFHY